ncbi:hypothetical protein [uncultured Cellulomonas sp.]|uniref:hypothetical protein n=1 Tax=uncultured Cellulomonas sp. TaxID=189682 RepID=UPI00262630B9|nr:hypothetical protein [uncultured Cellulomonas sp.]
MAGSPDTSTGGGPTAGRGVPGGHRMRTGVDDAAPAPADDDAPSDPAATAALIVQQRARLAAATDVDGRVLFGAWGLAWLLGFGLLYLTAGDDPLVVTSPTVAGVVFAGLLMTALVVTAVHVARRTAGLHGTSSVQGAMYGWTWTLGFVAIFALGGALARAGADPEVLGTVMTIAPPVLVGVLYMAGAALWRDRTQFVLGAWILVATVIASFAGRPLMLAVMAVAGGGGMLVGAVAEELRRRRGAAPRGAGLGGAAAVI